MTAATVRRSLTVHRLWWVLSALAVAAIVAAALLGMRSAQAGTEAKALIAPARAAALIQATSGEESEAVRAVGDQAKLINAGLPFDRSPLKAARPFDMAADNGLDHRRALLCLTQAVYYEAGFEPIDGRRAVAQVVLNRMRHPAYPRSVCGVVYQRNATPVCQFSFVCDGSLDRRPEPGAWRAAQAVAAAALSGFVERSVGSATHYHADYVAPRWAPMLAKVAKLGAHIFYRWPGAWGQPAAFTGRYAGEPHDPSTLRPRIRTAQGEALDLDAAIAPTGPVTDGTQLKRAPNDVGGLLDTSKGWTLNIPLPSEIGSAAKAVASEQGAPATSPAPTQLAAR